MGKHKSQKAACKVAPGSRLKDKELDKVSGGVEDTKGNQITSILTRVVKAEKESESLCNKSML